MISLLIAAAVSAATPTTPATPAPTVALSPDQQMFKDAPLVCAAHFIEEMKITGAGLKKINPVVIDVYAEKTGISPVAKQALTNFCQMFDLGAGFIIVEMNEQAKQNRPHGMGHPTDKIASYSFTR